MSLSYFLLVCLALVSGVDHAFATRSNRLDDGYISLKQHHTAARKFRDLLQLGKVSLPSSVRCVCPENVPSECNALDQTDYRGGDMIRSAIQTRDPGFCCERCQQTNGCVAWVLNTDTGGCWLKNQLNPSSSCSYCIAGALESSTENNVPESCNVQYNTDYFGGDMFDNPINTNAPEVCCQECEATDGCVGWVLNNQDGHCWLKSALSNAISCSFCTAGTRDPPNTSPNESPSRPELETCENQGTSAAVGAAIAACSVVKDRCPSASSSDEANQAADAAAGQNIPSVLDEGIEQLCNVVYEESCKRSIIRNVASEDRDCFLILESGPGQGVQGCESAADANRIFDDQIGPLCGYQT